MSQIQPWLEGWPGSRIRIEANQQALRLRLLPQFSEALDVSFSLDAWKIQIFLLYLDSDSTQRDGYSES
jgi:hypothetical protein